MPWGLREFQVEDCNGYTLCFGSQARAAGRSLGSQRGTRTQ